MSSALEKLTAVLERFDDDAYVALASRGLLRRAHKDLEQQTVAVIEDGANEVVVSVGAQRVQFDHRGPAYAKCACPASGVCQHILAAAIGVQRLRLEVLPQTSSETVNHSLAPLHDALLAITATQLIAHAGKAGFRWAWQYVHDLEPEQMMAISGTQHLLLAFQRPHVTLRYMGGSIEGLIADVNLPHAEKYRVAAVLAFQRAHGREIVPPEPTARQRSRSLDLGMDHALAESREATVEQSRALLRIAMRKIFAESMEIGLTHLSRGIHERYSTLAVWAQGAEYPRLALLTRRIADHIELLLERTGNADESRLLEEITITFGLVSALESAAAKGLTPHHLVGHTRSRYEGVAGLELIGLGAQAWRSAAGYVGLTMLFWSPRDNSFLSCTDARPESQRAFNPVPRYSASGPWTGLGSPAQATGQKVLLQGAQVNDAGRISAAAGCHATVVAIDSATLIKQLQPCESWSALRAARNEQHRSILAEAQPMKDWVALKPAHFGAVQFDEARQTMVWPLRDRDELTISAELAFSEFSRHCIGRIEQLKPAELVAGTLVIARLRTSTLGELVAEPMSLVRPGKDRCPVDALCFDAAPDPGLMARTMERFKRVMLPADAAPRMMLGDATLSTALREFRHEIQTHAERGVAPESAAQVRAALIRRCEHLADGGLTAFRIAAQSEIDIVELLLRVNYLSMQCERIREVLGPLDLGAKTSGSRSRAGLGGFP